MHIDEIEAAASRLLYSAFGSPETIAYPLDLSALVYDYLCEQERLVFDDETDLGDEDGDLVLGKMLPLRNRVLISSRLKSEPLGRYRFTVAHEIGHWVLHRPLFLAVLKQKDLFGTHQLGTVGTTSLHRNVFAVSGTRRVPPEEWQANSFAIALLIQGDLLRENFTGRFGNPPIARCQDSQERAPSIRALSRDVASRHTKEAPSLAQVFGLSREAMAIALEARGYVVEQAPIV